MQKSVPTVIRLGQEIDETSKLSKWNVPLAHYLEFWGDGRASDGSYVSVQPMICRSSERGVNSTCSRQLPVCRSPKGRS
ncbi:MAG: hypothetical protein WDN28_21730 [Chthoniobacter sp.]